MISHKRTNQQKRSVILLPCLLTGGTEVVTLALEKALNDFGFRVDVIVYFDEIDPLMLNAFRRSGIKVITSTINRSGTKANFLLAVFLARTLFKNNYNLVWLQYMTPTLVPLLVARCFTRHLVAAVHVAAGHYNQQGIRRIRWLARYWCNRFVCVSRTVASGIFGADWSSGIYAKQVVVIPNSLDSSDADASVPKNWHDELSWPQERKIVGYCGRLAVNKGADILINAAAMLIRQGHDIGVVLVGDGEERARLQSLATQSGIDDHIYFAGRVPRDGIYSAIKGFDIAVVPSREEGFGLSALEAMACGVAVVASNVDALSEIIVDGETGILFRSQDTVDLAAAISRLIDDPQLSQVLAKQAVHHVRENYHHDQFSTGIADLVAGTVSNKSSA